MFCLLEPVAQANALTKADRNAQIQGKLVGSVRKQLFTLPYYDVFDWLDAEVGVDGNVTLKGEVVRPNTKTDAENRVRAIESVTNVKNEIQVLPLSSADNELRLALYRAIYNSNSSLARYGLGAMPSIHIVVNNGRATLKGVVATQADSQLAYTAARQVSGLFDVRNELRIER
jgi:hyperosmotically inducible protein